MAVKTNSNQQIIIYIFLTVICRKWLIQKIRDMQKVTRKKFLKIEDFRKEAINDQ